MGRKKKHFIQSVQLQLEFTPFACGLCEDKFKNIREFYKHFALHREVTVEHFHLCKDSFNESVKEEIDNPSPFVCDGCYVAFPTVCQLHKHMESSSEIEEYKIVIESRRAYSLPSLCADATTKNIEISLQTPPKSDLTFASSNLTDAESDTGSVKLEVVSDIYEEFGKTSPEVNIDSRFLECEEIKDIGSGSDTASFEDAKLEILSTGGVKGTTLDHDICNGERGFTSGESTFGSGLNVDKDNFNNAAENNVQMNIIQVSADEQEIGKNENDVTEKHETSSCANDGTPAAEEKVIVNNSNKLKEYNDNEKGSCSSEISESMSIDIMVATKEEIKEQLKQEKGRSEEIGRKRRLVRHSRRSKLHGRRPKRGIALVPREYIRPATHKLCGVCNKRIRLTEYDEHMKTEHLQEEDLNDIHESEEYDDQSENVIRPRRKKNINFAQYADSDVDSGDEDAGTVFEQNNERERNFFPVVKKKNTRTKGNLNKDPTIKSECVGNETDARNLDLGDDINKTLIEESKDGDSNVGLSGLDAVLEKANHSLNKGDKNVQFRVCGISYVITPHRLLVYCPHCGLKFGVKSFKSHLRQFHYSLYDSDRELRLQLDTVRRKSRLIKVDRVDKVTSKPKTKSRQTPEKIISVFMTKKQKEAFRRNEIYRKNIDYDWDCIPKKSRKKPQTFEQYYRPCPICGVRFRNNTIPEHLEYHKTEEGKRKYSPQNLIKCKHCSRVCMKSTFAIHKCHRDLLKKKRAEEERKTRVKPGPKRIRQIFDDVYFADKPTTVSHSSKMICEVCGKVLGKGLSSLRDHMIEAHSDEFPYPCGQCEKRFKQQKRLDYHVKLYHSGKSFHCDQCTMSFISQGRLNAHYVVHNDERNIPCPQCEKTFRRMANLRLHKRSFHDNDFH
ncbi:uncharacterized protein LOC123531747 isoform X2 [Mercenaria mercenaria]|uniref:uncharacterized protein LOC123531747 isoform X2 n=1 Tax=Mercenaria mercenaria TaxID=6596 RepID=UPI00234E4854|nr:uncharacterized protein LOC123531747 isoform X2 [Mercenaria mercenaria]